MTAIPKRALQVGRFVWKHNGTGVDLYSYVYGGGAFVVFQKPDGGRLSRVSGRNLPTFLEQLEAALNEGEAEWAWVDNARLDRAAAIIRAL